jgi:hypothetical protein
MEALSHLLSKLTTFAETGLNFVYAGIYHHKPTAPRPNPHTIAKHQTTIRHALQQWLYPWEVQNITELHRRSEISEEAILADFFNGDIPKHEIPWDEHTTFALEYTLDRFRPPQKCRPVHLLDVEHHYPFKWTVNTEPPFSTDQYFLKQLPLGTPPKFGAQRGIVFAFTRRWHHIIKRDAAQHSRYRWPMLLHTKTAIVKQDDPNKMRTIWGYPKPAILAEIMFFWEYLAWIKRNPGKTPLLWGYETLTGGWLRLNAELFSSYVRCSFFTLDWKRFDKYALFDLMRPLLTGTRAYMDFDHGYVPTVDYPEYPKWNSKKSQRLENLWNWMFENIFCLPIVLPDGRMYTRQHAGIPSGLYLTQLLDSLYNMVILTTVLHSLGLPINSYTIVKVMGDDSIIRLSFIIHPGMHNQLKAAIAATAAYYFGAILSLDKSECRSSLDECEVLGYRHIRGLPFRNPITLLASLYHTKAKSPTPEKTMAQCIGIAYASAGIDFRIYNICHEIFSYYEDQGYTASHNVAPFVSEDPTIAEILDIDFSHFPSIGEIQSSLLSTDHDNSKVNRRFFNDDHFLRII